MPGALLSRYQRSMAARRPAGRKTSGPSAPLHHYGQYCKHESCERN
jgi:hypothetical protein